LKRVAVSFLDDTIQFMVKKGIVQEKINTKKDILYATVILPITYYDIDTLKVFEEKPNKKNILFEITEIIDKDIDIGYLEYKLLDNMFTSIYLNNRVFKYYASKLSPILVERIYLLPEVIIHSIKDKHIYRCIIYKESNRLVISLFKKDFLIFFETLSLDSYDMRGIQNFINITMLKGLQRTFSDIIDTKYYIYGDIDFTTMISFIVKAEKVTIVDNYLNILFQGM